jgi:hypothetical protein
VGPVEESYLLKSKITEVDPSLNFRLVVRDREHGFDQSANLRDGWLRDAIQFKACLE